MSTHEESNQEVRQKPITDDDPEKRAARLEESLARLARSAGLPLLLRALAEQDPSELTSLKEAVSRLECHPLWETLMKQDQQELVESNGQKTRYGAPDGPRKLRRNFNGQDPLDYPGHEALAQFLATPRSEREFKSLTALAGHFKVTRMTVHRWKRNPDVLRRAELVARGNKPAGDLIAKANWKPIVRAQVDAAIAGDTQAAKFCERRAWPEDGQADSRLLSSTSIVEACRSTENLGEIPTWLQRQIEAQRIEADARASNGNGDSEPPKLGTDGK
jgi:hypothetical protein